MKKGEIWLIEFPISDGHEQAGTRPVIVIAEMPPIAVIIPFTSNIQALRFPNTKEVKPSSANGLKADSIALVFQIRAIDIKRFKKKIGNLDNSIMKQIDEMLKRFLDLK